LLLTLIVAPHRQVKLLFDLSQAIFFFVLVPHLGHAGNVISWLSKAPINIPLGCVRTPRYHRA
ncbi:TPA: hypothetical protein ACYZXY_004900, partial [Escherichia coli]